MAKPRKGRGIGARLNSLQKGRESAREDRAAADSLRREHGDLLVRKGGPKFDSFAEALRKAIAAENEDIEDEKKLRTEYDASWVMEVSYCNITMTVRYNRGTFADALGAHPPSMDVTFGPNPGTAANIPGLQRLPGNSPVGVALRMVTVELKTDGTDVSWWLDEYLEDDDLAVELLERFERYYRDHLPRLSR